MQHGFAHEFGRAEHCLLSQAGRDLARQPHLQTAGDQSLDHHVDIRRSAARERSHRMHQVFLDKDHHSHGVEYALDDRALLGGAMRVRRDRRGALLDHHGDIRHGAEDRHRPIGQLLDQRDGHSCREREQDLRPPQGLADLFKHLRERTRLDGADDDVGPGHGFGIAAGRDGDAILGP